MNQDDVHRSGWAGTWSVRPERTHRPQSLAELVDAIRSESDRDPPGQVRPIGSGWAFSPVASSPDCLIDTTRLDRPVDDVLEGLYPTTVPWSADPNGEPFGYCHVEAGMTLCALSSDLASGAVSVHRPGRAGPVTADGWALATTAGAGGQTIGGAIATGTHGAEPTLPPLTDAVQALHLVGPGGRQHWIEPIRPGVEWRRILQQRYPGIRVHQDNDLFEAALVSLGRFGVVYSVVLRVVPQFQLVERRMRTTWDLVADQLTTDGLLGSHRAVQVVLPPHRRPDGHRTCYLTVRDTAPSEPRSRARRLNPMQRVLLTRRLPAGALGEVFRRTCVSFQATLGPRSAQAMVAAALFFGQRPRTVEGPSQVIMSSPPDAFHHVRGGSVEIFLDASGDHHLAVLENHVFPVLDRYVARHGHLIGWVGLRFVAPTRATLGMQRWSPTLAIEIAVLRGSRQAGDLLAEIQQVAVQQGGTVHWGQQVDLGERDIDSCYPKMGSWRSTLAEYLMLSEPAIDIFQNEFCRYLGLRPDKPIGV